MFFQVPGHGSWPVFGILNSNTLPNPEVHWPDPEVHWMRIQSESGSESLLPTMSSSLSLMANDRFFSTESQEVMSIILNPRYLKIFVKFRDFNNFVTIWLDTRYLINYRCTINNLNTSMSVYSVYTLPLSKFFFVHSSLCLQENF